MQNNHLKIWGFYGIVVAAFVACTALLFHQAEHLTAYDSTATAAETLTAITLTRGYARYMSIAENASDTAPPERLYISMDMLPANSEPSTVRTMSTTNASIGP